MIFRATAGVGAAANTASMGRPRRTAFGENNHRYLARGNRKPCTLFDSCNLARKFLPFRRPTSLPCSILLSTLYPFCISTRLCVCVGLCVCVAPKATKLTVKSKRVASPFRASPFISPFRLKIIRFPEQNPIKELAFHTLQQKVSSTRRKTRNACRKPITGSYELCSWIYLRSFLSAGGIFLMAKDDADVFGAKLVSRRKPCHRPAFAISSLF